MDEVSQSGASRAAMKMSRMVVTPSQWVMVGMVSSVTEQPVLVAWDDVATEQGVESLRNSVKRYYA